jgi:peptidoglycan/xylan/chitin deacetylase (PgdA/CDA1 family)
MNSAFYRKFSTTLLFIIGLFYSYEIQDAATVHLEPPTKQVEILSCDPHTGYIIPDNTNTGTIEVTNCIKEPDIQFFMYHYVRTHDPRDNAATTDLSIDPWNFREHMKYVQKLRNDWIVYTMNWSELIEAIQRDCFPAKRIWIFTSDDGWIDSYTDLFTIAHEYRVPFFIGIIANRLDIPGFMSTKQVQEIAQNPLFTITSHSITHSDHSRLDESLETQEICESKKILEKIIEKPIFRLYLSWGENERKK